MAQKEWKAWAVERPSGTLVRDSDGGICLYSSRNKARKEAGFAHGRVPIRVTVSIDPDQGEKP